MINTMDCRLITLAKKTLCKQLNQELKTVEHRKKLLQENLVDLNQLEKEMLETLDGCGVNYKHVVTTKYYPKRRHL